MKIRQGFVSNSSSSSFCGYGISTDDISKLTSESDNMDDMSNYDMLEEIFSKYKERTGEETFLDWSSCEDTYYIGRVFSSINEDETWREFKKKTEEEFKKVFGENILKDYNLSFIEEAWMDS